MGSTTSLYKSNEDPNRNWKRNLQTLEERQFHMYKNGIGTDLILEIGNHTCKAEIEVHSSVLISNSDYFEAQIKRWTLRKDNGKPLIELAKDQNSIGTIKIFIETLYKNEYEPVSVEEGIELLKLSHFYCCERLVANNQQFLLKTMDMHNIIEIYQCARKLKVNSEDFYEKVFDFIAANATEIFTEPRQIRKLNYYEFHEILECNTLVIDELKLFKAIVIWSKFLTEENQGENIAIFAKNLTQLIRFSLMKLEDFSTYVKGSQLMTHLEENQVYTYLCQSTLGKKLERNDLIEIKNKYSMKFSIDQRLISEKITLANFANTSEEHSEFSLTFAANKTIYIFGLEISANKNYWKYSGIDKNKIQDVQCEISFTIGNSLICCKKTNCAKLLKFDADSSIKFDFHDGIIKILPRHYYSIKYNVQMKSKILALKTNYFVQHECMNISNDSMNYKSTKATFEYQNVDTCLPFECFTLKNILYSIHE